MSLSVPEPLKRFIWDIQSMVELTESEREILFIGRDLMGRLVATDDWLPEAFARSDQRRSQQYLLFHDTLERFCVTSTVLGEGQSLLVRQDKVWEIFGVLRGSAARSPWRETTASTADAKLYERASVEVNASKNGGAFQLGNAGPAVAIVIHAYGGEIGAISRHALGDGGAVGEAIGQYANPEDAPAYDIFSIQTEIKD
jgi:3-mercaptopropionate dioxygenase